jgi:RimJ/RimL family protein N-acetyltransferase
MSEVREIQQSDIEHIARYWLTASDDFLVSMGVDLSKMPTKEQWENMLQSQIETPLKEKQSFCLIWLYEGKPVGHSNINKIIFGEEAFMHLHLWEPALRKSGLGINFIRMCLPIFFKNYQLKKLCCEPMAANPAPNKLLEKIGFSFIKQYITTPGWINYEQMVNRWEIVNGQW